MNIKPTPDLIQKWRQQAEYTTGFVADRMRIVAELSAQWGAEQERAKWLKENAPEGWIDDLRKQAQQTAADAARVLEWMRTPDRKPANLAFTDGPERQAAYWIEIAQQRVAQQTTEPELPEPEAIRHSFDGYGWMYIDNGHGSGWRSGIDKADAEFMYTAAQMHDHFAAGVRAGAAGIPWQPIDSAPQDGTKVLAYTNDGYKYPLVCQCVWGDGAWWPDVWESPAEPLSPTHWMPLLTPPKNAEVI